MHAHTSACGRPALQANAAAVELAEQCMRFEKERAALLEKLQHRTDEVGPPHHGAQKMLVTIMH